MQLNNIDRPPASAEPATQLGITCRGSAAANDIAPSVIKARPIMKFVGPDFLSLSVNLFELNSSRINKINEDKEIIVKKDSGYALLDNYKEEETHHTDFLPKQRINIIISQLLTNKDIDIFDLADELFVSRPTIENDFKKVRKIIESFDITLSCNSDRYSLNGLEKDKRKLTSYMIRNTDYKGFSYYDSNFFLNKEYSTDNLKTRIQDIFKQCHFVYNDYSINNVLLHLTITIERLKNKYTLEKNTCSSIDSESLRASKMIFEYLKEEYYVEYDEAEINNLAVFLSCNIATIDCKKPTKILLMK